MNPQAFISNPSALLTGYLIYYLYQAFTLQYVKTINPSEPGITSLVFTILNLVLFAGCLILIYKFGGILFTCIYLAGEFISSYRFFSIRRKFNEEKDSLSEFTLYAGKIWREQCLYYAVVILALIGWRIYQ